MADDGAPADDADDDADVAAQVASMHREVEVHASANFGPAIDSRQLMASS